MMSYERLDAYQCSIRFLALANRITSELPRGSRDLADQIKRAAMTLKVRGKEPSLTAENILTSLAAALWNVVLP